MCVQTHIYTFAKNSTQSRYRKAATVRKINVFKNAYLNVNGGKNDNPFCYLSYNYLSLRTMSLRTMSLVTMSFNDLLTDVTLKTKIQK